MNVDMHGKKIAFICWMIGGEEQLLRSNDGRQLVLSATYHGDRDEFWVLVMEGNTELRRFNTKTLSEIHWQPSGEGEGNA